MWNLKKKMSGKNNTLAPSPPRQRRYQLGRRNHYSFYPLQPLKIAMEQELANLAEILRSDIGKF
jgi:hypothetical protein